MDSIDLEQEQLRHKTFLSMFRILLIFGIPAIVSYFLGGWIDTTYDMKPYGTLSVLGVAFLLSWTLTIRMYFQIDRAFRELRQKQEARENDENEKKTHKQQ
ncbi:MAG: hypothetical protein CO029_03845 [Candidatus Magasanikbacteria bacterium CG_4_9_14_0_2_um_filter_41_10]|uniref:AtpZ/AtpI family protein n=1 Tax=Candidatus Magasanikbacteria bacterium CG_4_10_14_0_2_um_filter_41_31 TaxID=1974639 RepID=A0A2M7V4C1_9BACT|nr:MAG: hypothetical protein AUJ37_00970 [Candidatus Magasanikbacteria bacterium CG1_02_41_34]PIZ93397.1 MAG: hypothetical protein COX83_01965 [Candidatus Magasanikbacteria bacterium CG_4_10_14_0_2_um_filter_41_31]PJC53198.1 MAG: hypothetical protein CO029_03845 [Candidatus Magasanikbacteria bacterium CG_4_9_14_0_2_um_filter_41_10]